MKGLLTLKQRPRQWSVLEISVRSQGGLMRTIITILQDDTDKNHPARGPSEWRGVIIRVFLLKICMRPPFIFVNDWIHFQNTYSVHVLCMLSNFLKPLSISKMRWRLDTDTRVTRSRTYLEWASLSKCQAYKLLRHSHYCEPGWWGHVPWQYWVNCSCFHVASFNILIVIC